MQRAALINRLNLDTRAVIVKVHASLPESIREAAASVPIICQSRPGPELSDGDDLDDELLGLFCGPTHAEMDSGVQGGHPPCIYIFLDNIWDYAGGDPRVFRRELRKTYLHELGHYLGYDEEDLEARGLG